MIGQTMSHYKILEKLDIKAEDTWLKRTVALKFLHSSFSLDDEVAKRERLE